MVGVVPDFKVKPMPTLPLPPLGTLPIALSACALLCGLASPAQAGKKDDTLTWSTADELGSIDLYSLSTRAVGIIAYQVCDTLMHRNVKTREYEPLLATQVNWVDDLTLDVTLRKGVRFHNGKPFSAEDVVYTFQHASASDSYADLRFSVDWIKSVEALADDKVRFKLAKPNPTVMEYLSGITPIYPKGHYDQAAMVAGPGGKTRRDWGAVLPVCTGPYKITQFIPGKSVTMERNPDYFKGGPKGTPRIGKQVFRTIVDTQTQIAELLTGGVDWIWSLPKDDADKIGRMGRVTVAPAPTLRISALVFDASARTGPNPFTDLRVRQAVNYAIDKNAIATNLVGPQSQVIHGPCYPTQFGCTDDGVTKYPYDPARAKALLAEAGYPNGFTMTINYLRDRPYTEAVVGYLRAVGIKAEPKFTQAAAFNPAFASGSMTLTHWNWGSVGVNDASASFGRSFRGQGEDYARDAEVKAWLDVADTTLDAEQRKALYKKALAKVTQQAYWAPLFTYVRNYAYNSDLDFVPTPDEISHFYAASWK